MKTKYYSLYVGLIAVLLLPASAWGQTAARLAEIGPNDFRITYTGAESAVDFDAVDPAVAYNTTDHEFLVVWAGDDVVDGAFEIFGQRLDAATGERLGAAVRLSDMGEADLPAFDALTPSVVYNTANHEYLVVWAGDDAVDGEIGLYGQRLRATDAQEIGENDFLIAAAPALYPAVAYNAAQNEYFVVWQGEDDVHAGAAEIFARRLDAATGKGLALDAIRVSDMGGNDADAGFDAQRPAVAYNGLAGEYLVVWEGDDDTAPHVEGASEIFGQRLSAETGEAMGTNDFAISDMGGSDAATAFGAHRPALAFNETHSEYLVVWLGDDDTSGLVDNEFEIFGQRLDAETGEAVGTNDFAISAMGTPKDARFAAAYPAVTFNPTDGDYLVVWRGDHNEGTLVDGEYEIYAQRLFGDRAFGDDHDGAGFRLSDMGSADGLAGFDAVQPAVVYGPDNSYFAVWSGDDDDAATDNKHEIFGQRFEAPTLALATFTAEVAGADAVELTWATTSQLAEAAFEVQHKTVGEFKTLARIDGGTTTTYAYRADKLFPGQHTFRLKQINADGSSTLSAEIEALIEVPGDFFFASAYPNPFNQSTTIALTVKETQHLELAVYDMLGRRVTTLFEGVVDANQARTFRFEAGAHPSGPYFIRAIGDHFVKTQQVLLVR